MSSVPLSLVDKFSGVSVAVLGDVILDEYIYGRVSRISPEAPVPVLEVESRTMSLGGAGNVARNIASLGGRVRLFSVVGSDAPADQLRDLTEAEGIELGGLVIDKARPTTLKQRVAARTQQIVRIDSEVISEIAEPVRNELIHRLQAAGREFDVLIVSDYDKGVISPILLAAALEAFSGKPIVVDPNVTHFFEYGSATVVTPNHLQLERVSGRRIRNEEELFETGIKIRAQLGKAAILVTRGEAGMALIDDDGITKIPTVAREVYDVTGAGDTVVAALALGLAVGHPLRDAARIANAAAGIVVEKRGTAVASSAELSERLAEIS